MASGSMHSEDEDGDDEADGAEEVENAVTLILTADPAGAEEGGDDDDEGAGSGRGGCDGHVKPGSTFLLIGL